MLILGIAKRVAQQSLLIECLLEDFGAAIPIPNVGFQKYLHGVASAMDFPCSLGLFLGQRNCYLQGFRVVRAPPHPP